MDRAQDRNWNIDLAKGIGIILVVLGHIAIADMPDHAVWCQRMTAFIYSFHMPAFMVLSGYIAAKYSRSINDWSSYKAFILTKFVRLMIPHLIFALVVYSIKGVLAGEPLGFGIYDDLLRVYYDPMRSEAVYLWFIYLLFLFSLITPFLRDLSSFIWRLLILVSVTLHFATVGISHKPVSLALIIVFLHFFTFYLLGYWSQRFDVVIKLIRRNSVLLCGSFLIASMWYCFIAPTDLLNTSVILRDVMAWLSIGPVLALIHAGRFSGLFVNLVCYIGLFSFPIYLMNTTIIGASKLVLTKAGVAWSSSTLPFHFSAACILSLLLPILMQVFFLEKVPVIKSIFKR